MILRVEVNPERLRWARDRAGLDADRLTRKFPKYEEWEAGTARPTLKQLEAVAKATHAPVGLFFMSEPWDEPVPIPDFRVLGNRPMSRPSVDLLETVYLYQQRQEWYRDFARLERIDPPALVRIATTRSDVETTARMMREALGFDVDQRSRLSTWVGALRLFVAQADASGILVMVNGIVGNNTTRRLDPAEFRGFALADDLAPLVFVNGADTKAAQMFTLAHELAHICLGESALSDIEAVVKPSHSIERWCDRVAAELLVPGAILANEFRAGVDLSAEVNRLARYFKVSTLVVLRRVFDLGALDREAFEAAYWGELDRLATVSQSGGNFHPTLRMRVGRRFGQALVDSTLGGRTSFTESFRLLGIRKSSTLRRFAASLYEGP